MAEKERKWDDWIGKATDRFGRNYESLKTFNSSGPIGTTIAAGASALKAAVDTYKEAKNKRPKSKDYQSMKDVKRIK